MKGYLFIDFYLFFDKQPRMPFITRIIAQIYSHHNHNTNIAAHQQSTCFLSSDNQSHIDLITECFPYYEGKLWAYRLITGHAHFFSLSKEKDSPNCTKITAGPNTYRDRRWCFHGNAEAISHIKGRGFIFDLFFNRG